MKLRKFIATTIHEYLNEILNKPQSNYFSNIGLKTEDVFDMIDGKTELSTESLPTAEPDSEDDDEDK